MDNLLYLFWTKKILILVIGKKSLILESLNLWSWNQQMFDVFGLEKWLILRGLSKWLTINCLSIAKNINLLSCSFSSKQRLTCDLTDFFPAQLANICELWAKFQAHPWQTIHARWVVYSCYWPTHKVQVLKISSGKKMVKMICWRAFFA